MGKRRTGHIERLPSGVYRAVVYAGTDPLTRRQQRLKSGSFRTEEQARIELGKLLGQAAEGQAPETGATVAQLLDEYTTVVTWDVSTRATNGGSSAAPSSRPSATCGSARCAARCSTSSMPG
jgi:integrase